MLKKIACTLTIIMLIGCSTISNDSKKTSQKPLDKNKTSQISDRETPLSENEKEFIKYCETANCRKNVKISLKKKDGSTFTFAKSLTTPVVQSGFITILAGETIYLEAEAGANGPINLEVVDKIENPEATITFEFKQNPDIGDGTNMILKVENPFDRAIRYRLGLMTPDSGDVYATSSCPVRAGISIIEMWPYPIFQLIFSEIIFIDEGIDDFSCKE